MSYFAQIHMKMASKVKRAKFYGRPMTLHHKLYGKIFLVLCHQFYQVITQSIIS